MPLRSLRSKSSGSSKSLWTLQHLRAVPQSGRFQSNCIWYLQEIKLELWVVFDSGVLQLFVLIRLVEILFLCYCFWNRFLNNHLTGSPCGSGESLVCHRDVVERIAGVKVRLHCTMIPLSTRSCLKSNKLRSILNGQFCHVISNNICLNVFSATNSNFG